MHSVVLLFEQNILKVTITFKNFSIVTIIIQFRLSLIDKNQMMLIISNNMMIKFIPKTSYLPIPTPKPKGHMSEGMAVHIRKITKTHDTTFRLIS